MKLFAVMMLMFNLSNNTYAEINFDKGVSRESLNKDITNIPVPDVKYGVPGSVRYTRDCARFNFGPSDNELMSEKVRLRSDEYRTECYTTYVTGPNGQQIPQQNCYERLYMTYHRQAQINLKPRKLWPWERESFEVCLEGNWMDLYVIEAGYKYKVKQVGYSDTLFELYPERKIAMKPDIDGLNYVEFTYNKDTKKYTFIIKDKWSKEYNGEKVYIKIELKKDKANWFDSLIGYKEYTFIVSNEYKIEFSEDELMKYTNNNDDTIYRNDDKLFETRGYYLKWGFKRIGEISKDTYVDKGETNRIQK
ncbi:MAG: hypothetical protein N2Z20_03210 [Elusimicrobiales bacterium]|nr:hypothetical protein [Elusimicrobiales bacterium]